ncbi:MAG: ferric reductase-like transmembrane domain-containing protein [Propionicimonas sp.]
MSGALWYLSRATGVVTVVALTLVVCLGIVTAGRRRPHGESATIVMGLHRWLSLGMLVFLGVHIATAILDGYVSISWLAVVVPFISDYEPLLIGLGAIAVDLLIVVMVTSYLRHRIPERRWRLVHWISYLMWLVALGHGFAMGTADQPGLRMVTVACGTIGGLLVAWRIAVTYADKERRKEIDAQEWS